MPKLSLLPLVLLIATGQSTNTCSQPSSITTVALLQLAPSSTSTSLPSTPRFSGGFAQVFLYISRNHLSILLWFLGIAGTLVSGVLIRILSQFCLDWLKERAIRKKLQKEPYTIREIKTYASEIYVRPDCQDNDPSSGGKPVNRTPVFKELDKLLGPPSKAPCILILADSGMGKTSLLAKYYAYHWISAKRSTRFNLVVVPLNRFDRNELIERIPSDIRSETVLCLDALDEDRTAIDDYDKRLQDFADLTATFQTVVITCRTQFFQNECDIHIPSIIQSPSRPASLGELAPVEFKKIYIAPLSNVQIKTYLKKRFSPFIHPILYRRALHTIKRFADLISRPMLLAHIEDLLKVKGKLEFSFQIYEIIVQEWLRREVELKLLARDKQELLEFSQKLAGDLFTTKRDRLSQFALQRTASLFSVTLNIREIRQRSLINRDIEGNWKFAHRSIQEFLLVRACSLSKAPPVWVGPTWTDQMRDFAKEMICAGHCSGLPGSDLSNIDFKEMRFGDMVLTGARLDGCDLRGADLEKVYGLSVQQIPSARSDEQTRWPVRMLKGHKGDIRACAISSRSEFIVTSSSDRTLKVWEASSGQLLHTLKGHRYPAGACAVSLQDDFMISASIDCTVKVWDPAEGKLKHTLKGHDNTVWACAISPRGNFIVSASDDYTLKVWNPTSGKELRTLVGHRNYVRSCAVSPRGDFIVSASYDSTLKVWDATSGKEVFSMAHGSPVKACAVSPRSGFIVSASDYSLKVWEAASGKELHELSIVKNIANANVCVEGPQGTFILCASNHNTLMVWDITSG